jgi:sporulation protein YlmC with PRC-barrel domain
LFTIECLGDSHKVNSEIGNQGASTPGEESAVGKTIKTTKTGVERKGRHVLAASTLAGGNVRNAAGEHLGRVTEVMIEMPSGQVSHAVLSVGTGAGASKLLAVPWSAFGVQAGDRNFILNVDRQALEEAPAFDRNNWPDMSDSAWASEVFRYYAATPYWERPETKAKAKAFCAGWGGH